MYLKSVSGSILSGTKDDTQSQSGKDYSGNNNNRKETNLNDDKDEASGTKDETGTRYVCVMCGDKEVPVFRETTV